MRIEEFKILKPKKQQQLVVEKGVPIGMRKSQHFSIHLYAIDSFYVELFFFKETGEYITLKPFEEVELLTPYLQDIDIRPLLVS